MLRICQLLFVCSAYTRKTQCDRTVVFEAGKGKSAARHGYVLSAPTEQRTYNCAKRELNHGASYHWRFYRILVRIVDRA